jgi:hypothetical protein
LAICTEGNMLAVAVIGNFYAGNILAVAVIVIMYCRK